MCCARVTFGNARGMCRSLVYRFNDNLRFIINPQSHSSFRSLGQSTVVTSNVEHLHCRKQQGRDPLRNFLSSKQLHCILTALMFYTDLMDLGCILPNTKKSYKTGRCYAPNIPLRYHVGPKVPIQGRYLIRPWPLAMTSRQNVTSYHWGLRITWHGCVATQGVNSGRLNVGSFVCLSWLSVWLSLVVQATVVDGFSHVILYHGHVTIPWSTIHWYSQWSTVSVMLFCLNNNH